MAKDLSKDLDQAAMAAQAVKKPKPRPALASPMVNMPDDLRDPCADILVTENISFRQLVLPLLVVELKKRGVVPSDYKLDLASRGGGGGGAKLVAAEAKIADKEKHIAELEARLAKLEASKK